MRGGPGARTSLREQPTPHFLLHQNSEPGFRGRHPLMRQSAHLLPYRPSRVCLSPISEVVALYAGRPFCSSAPGSSLLPLHNIQDTPSIEAMCSGQVLKPPDLFLDPFSKSRKSCRTPRLLGPCDWLNSSCSLLVQALSIKN
jgi:hypothetical protein